LYNLNGTGNVAFQNIGWASSQLYETAAGLSDQGGNVVADPMFASPATGDYRALNPIASGYGRYAGTEAGAPTASLDPTSTSNVPAPPTTTSTVGATSSAGNTSSLWVRARPSATVTTDRLVLAVPAGARAGDVLLAVHRYEGQQRRHDPGRMVARAHTDVGNVVTLTTWSSVVTGSVPRRRSGCCRGMAQPRQS